MFRILRISGLGERKEKERASLVMPPSPIHNTKNLFENLKLSLKSRLFPQAIKKKNVLVNLYVTRFHQHKEMSKGFHKGLSLGSTVQKATCVAVIPDQKHGIHLAE